MQIWHQNEPTLRGLLVIESESKKNVCPKNQSTNQISSECGLNPNSGQILRARAVAAGLRRSSAFRDSSSDTPAAYAAGEPDDLRGGVSSGDGGLGDGGGGGGDGDGVLAGVQVAGVEGAVVGGAGEG